MDGWAHHLIVAPIALPLVAGALLAVYDEVTGYSQKRS